jgi:uncharacterized protein YjiS (DUF1127 family)
VCPSDPESQSQLARNIQAVGYYLSRVGPRFNRGPLRRLSLASERLPGKQPRQLNAVLCPPHFVSNRRHKRNATETSQKNGRYRKGIVREHFVVAVKQMESSQMSRSVSKIRAAYRSLRDHRTRIRASRHLAAMEDAFLKDIGISRAEIHYSVARRSRHEGAALLSA